MLYYPRVAAISLPVVIEPDEDKYHAWVPALPVCHTFGTTIEEAMDNIKEAAALHLEMLLEEGEEPPRAEFPC